MLNVMSPVSSDGYLSTVFLQLKQDFAAGLDHYDIRLLKYLYYNQVASIQIENSRTQRLPIKRGVQQGCVLSRGLFNIYSEEIFKEALEDRQEGVRIGGGISILAENLEDLQTLVNLVNEASRRKGLKINISKTKWMTAGKVNVDQCQLWLGGERIERVHHFKYLGSWLNVNGDSDEEIMTRIEISQGPEMLCVVHPIIRLRDMGIKNHNAEQTGSI
ncbi:uncharacterized protein LOC143258902 [Megalopta genalis]|uniref:uncharacterized protein LOC143258902 n=1 Tax=Megalopta genalis TaxID=115081 RepID=UPI003FD6A766